ncbi:MAG: 3-hydroxyacyl-CoA dehydrogenase NAD-binding domain-containing protein [Acidobacteriota bacterium]
MIRTVGIVGAGTMGAQIGALFASIGVDVWLLDLTPQLSKQSVDRMRKMRPDPFYTPDAAARIRTGGFDQHFDALSECDWIIEAVVERADIKRPLLERIDKVRRPGTIVSTNTSGLSVTALAEGRSEDFRRHWLGTHFFNPPRYLRLIEIIPTPATDADVLARVQAYADLRLGKGVVVAKDTPNFIANHIGVHGVFRVLDALATGRYTIEEIDAMTGPAIGRPKSATFRTLDIAGIDIFAHVARTLAETLTDPDARRAFEPPPLVQELIARGWIGEKAGQGFYKRVKGPGGQSQILVLDPATMDYRPSQRVSLPALEAARAIEDPGPRLRTLFLAKDRVGDFTRATLGSSLLYAAQVAPDIAHGIDDVDRAMRWGFGWDIGPFEILDQIGVGTVLGAVPHASAPVLAQKVLDAGRDRFRQGALPPAGPGLEILRTAREQSRVVKQNAGASLIDLGDGVLGVEFHSKMNALGGDAIEMLHAGTAEAARNFRALVVGNESVNFSAGANLMLLLMEAQEGNWDEIDMMVRAFQGATAALKYADVPVVVAPVGLAIGGGCEVVLHGDRVQAAAETYLGLVEVGVGLIPAGGGTKEMLIRCLESRPPGSQADLLPFVQRAFETIAFGKVAASGPDAKRMGYLRSTDAITMNRDRLIADAKTRALARAAEGYQPPARPMAIPVGGENVRAALSLGVHLARRGDRISDHDALIGRKLAWILAGGSVPHATTVSEQHVLDLEREAFISLCGEPKTLERIGHTLKTGKTLRN